jgi:predicted nuclease of predicted toxin-antitoxin system
VRILLDECVDWRLARDLSIHEVKTARQMGWTTVQNGELLALASKQFDIFVTIDQNLSFQQNVSGLSISVMILRARTARLAELKRLVPTLLTTIATAQPGTVHSIDLAR